MIDVIELESCGSTNTYLAGISGELERDTVVVAREQTAGRGQRGNSWEASPGLNVTCSLLMFNRRGIKAAEQFVISEAVSLGIVDTLRRFLGDVSEEVKVKWPNDIYVGDRKICGILIEHSISNREINRSIIGIGINVNQREFVSDAPNPVSLFNIINREVAVDDVLRHAVEDIYSRLEVPGSEIHRAYNSELWHKDGNRYIDASTGERFHARIADVLPDGTLCLVDEAFNERRYLFKEVAVDMTAGES
ncbi:MAG: biotin--[acetyl-CoA-carboxylase] ligase [Bacteroides sp.]|nr:biotin--[acetyl-CoA-carboxylase] ligase [Bacteroides sp.]MCM1390557.1 biotin--[acetyl-CoA-carboxylase] ligase [Bacteroides sp.]